MRLAGPAWSAVVGALVFAATTESVCLAKVHPRFEPTDLGLEPGGALELDVQLGLVDGHDAARMVAPDFELDLGLVPGLELDLDGGFAVEGAGAKRLFDHTTRDNVWPSLKVGVFDVRDAVHDRAWALGFQLGPKLPTASGAAGVGVEGLVLLARMMGALHLVFEVGGLVDPRSAGAGRPVGAEAGVDLELELVPDRWSLLGELGGVWYRTADPAQLVATAGIQWSPSARLDVSLVAMLGVASGSDPFGLLIGFSPRFTLW